MQRKKRRKNKQKREVGGDSSDTTVDESVDSLQESVSSMESQPWSPAVNEPVVPSEDKLTALSENNTATVATIGSAETPDKSNEGGSGGPKSTEDQTPQIATSETVTQESLPEDSKNTVQVNPRKGSNPISNTDRNNDSKKGDREDHNKNVEPVATEAETGLRKNKGKKERDQQSKATPAAEQNQSQVTTIKFIQSNCNRKTKTKIACYFYRLKAEALV